MMHCRHVIGYAEVIYMAIVIVVCNPKMYSSSNVPRKSVSNAPITLGEDITVEGTHVTGASHQSNVADTQTYAVTHNDIQKLAYPFYVYIAQIKFFADVTLILKEKHDQLFDERWGKEWGAQSDERCKHCNTLFLYMKDVLEEGKIKKLRATEKVLQTWSDETIRKSIVDVYDRQVVLAKIVSTSLQDEKLVSVIRTFLDIYSAVSKFVRTCPSAPKNTLSTRICPLLKRLGEMGDLDATSLSLTLNTADYVFVDALIKSLQNKKRSILEKLVSGSTSISAVECAYLKDASVDMNYKYTELISDGNYQKMRAVNSNLQGEFAMLEKEGYIALDVEAAMQLAKDVRDLPVADEIMNAVGFICGKAENVGQDIDNMRKLCGIRFVLGCFSKAARTPLAFRPSIISIDSDYALLQFLMDCLERFERVVNFRREIIKLALTWKEKRPEQKFGTARGKTHIIREACEDLKNEDISLKSMSSTFVECLPTISTDRGKEYTKTLYTETKFLNRIFFFPDPVEIATNRIRAYIQEDFTDEDVRNRLTLLTDSLKDQILECRSLLPKFPHLLPDTSIVCEEEGDEIEVFTADHVKTIAKLDAQYKTVNEMLKRADALIEEYNKALTLTGTDMSASEQRATEYRKRSLREVIVGTVLRHLTDYDRLMSTGKHAYLHEIITKILARKRNDSVWVATAEQIRSTLENFNDSHRKLQEIQSKAFSLLIKDIQSLTIFM